MTTLKHYTISLADSVNLLKGHYRDYVMNAMNRWNCTGPMPFKTFDIDAVTFMVDLVKEIGDGLVNLEERQPPRATKILVDAGVDPKAAAVIAMAVYDATWGTIKSFFPNTTFYPGADDHEINFVDECDAMISYMPDRFYHEYCEGVEA